MWVYCENDIEIECEALETWERNSIFLSLKNCTVRKKITTKKGIAQIILNPDQIIAIGEEKLDWHELQRVR